MRKTQTFPVIEVPAEGKKDWSDGAWCLVWVYSTEGNFLLKGYRKECIDYIKKKGWKCWAIFNLYHSDSSTMRRAWYQPIPSEDDPKYRQIIETFKCDFNIYPSNLFPLKNPKAKVKGHKNSKHFKYSVYFKEYTGMDSLKLKRLPQNFVELKGELKK